MPGAAHEGSAHARSGGCQLRARRTGLPDGTAYRRSGWCGSSPPEAAQAAIDSGRIALVTDWQFVPRLKGVQVVVDATGSPELGVSIALECIRARKHIVMMNVECDVTVGPILNRMAREAGVIYTLAAGDEPAAILELYRFATALGFEVVAAGKGKNNPLDITATPEALAARAKARDMSARMLCEFVDGSKTAVEMCSVANATGLVPDVRGMHGAKATRDTLHQVFCPKSQGGVLNRRGVVDFAIGVHPGVFVVFTTDQPRLRHGLIQRDMGHGPNYLLFRPYHLCSIEVPLTAAQTVIYGESSGHPLARPVAECIAIAKRPLKAGETLDAIGEHCYRGSIDTVEAARQGESLAFGVGERLRPEARRGRGSNRFVTTIWSTCRTRRWWNCGGSKIEFAALTD